MARDQVEKVIIIFDDEPGSSRAEFELLGPTRATTVVGIQGFIMATKDVGDNAFAVACIQVERNGTVLWSTLTNPLHDPRLTVDVMWHCIFGTGPSTMDPWAVFQVDVRTKRTLEVNDRLVLSTQTNLSNSQGNWVGIFSIFHRRPR